MDFDYQVLKLTRDFYTAYNEDDYSELLKKDQRAYNCLLIDLHYDYFICVPYRSDIRHGNAYKFRNTKRSQKHQSGLDYTKIVIAKKSNYIDAEDAIIDKDEYNETVKHIDEIADEVNKYIVAYVKHMNGSSVLNEREFDRKYRFSTLKYFHNELGINE